MKKIFKILLFMLILNYCVCTSVFAALPQSLGKLTKPESTDDSYLKVGQFGTTFKYSSASGAVGAVLCTKHEDKSPAGEDTTCEMNSDWSVPVRAGVAAIIEKASVNNNRISEQYFYAVYTINQFLYNKRNDGASSDAGQNVVEKYGELSTNQYYIDYLKAANDAFNAAVNPTINLSTNELTFTLKGDEYVSNEITVTSDSALTISTNDFAKLNDNGNGKYTISVDKNEIEIGEQKTVNLNVSAVKSVSQARNYSCGKYIDSGDYNGNGNTTEEVDYQTLTPANYDVISITSNKTISGEIEINTSLTIKKVDDNNKLLSGVVLKVESEENNYSQTFTTTNEEITIEDLKFGKYTITEVSVPEGYVKLKNPVEVTISEGNLDVIKTINNSLTRVEISKISSADSKLLSGAILQIQDKDGNVLTNENGKKYEWTTTDDVYIVEGLPNGTYYLVEVSAPEGYALNEDKIEFVVDGETAVIEVEMKNDIEVKVPDTLSSKSALLITISMFDIFLGIGIITYVKKNKVQE